MCFFLMDLYVENNTKKTVGILMWKRLEFLAFYEKKSFFRPRFLQFMFEAAYELWFPWFP